MEAELVGRRLKEWRNEAGLSQRELAEPEFSHAYVSSVEAGKMVPSRTAIEHFASRLGRDVDELLTGRPPDFIPRLELELQEARRAASSGRRDEAESTFIRLGLEAEKFELNRLRAKAVMGLGLCDELRGDLTAAVARYEGAEELLKQEPATARAGAIASRARCLQMLGETRTAVYILEQALEALDQENLPDPDALVRLHSSLVACYFELGAYRKADASAEKALGLAPRSTNPENQANMHLNVARIFLSKGRVEDAEASVRRAEDLFRELDFRQELARCHHARGFVMTSRGDIEAAREHFSLAVAEFREAKVPLMTARSLTELARAERVAGNNEVAMEHLTEARALLGDKDIFDLAEVLREQGLLQLELDPDGAVETLREAAALFKSDDQSVEYGATCRMIGDLLAERGDLQAALEVYRAGLTAIEERL